MTDLYVVMGNPIAHSKSPQIHAAFAAQTGQDLDYQRCLVPLDGFEQAVTDFYQRGGKGFNITVPFKQEAWAICQQRSARAELAGAVNTIWFNEQGHCVGDNTDGLGLVRDIAHNHQCSLKDKKILILGAGGAVRGVLEPILAEQPSRILIANRTLSKAQELVTLFNDPRLSACAYSDLGTESFDIIINGTSASLQGELPPLPSNVLAAQGVAYDMMYSQQATAFQQWAHEHGAALALDGLGMLVEQAAEAFKLWRGVRPETQTVMQQLRESK